MSGNSWQPIETAPKEGERLLCAHFDEIGGYWRLFTAFWNTYDGGFWQHGGIKEHPTLWKPLPDPPDFPIIRRSAA